MQELPKELAIQNFSRALKGAMNKAVSELIESHNYNRLNQREISKAIWLAAKDYAAYEDKHYGHSKS
jgi:hypothetical protein